MPHQSLPVNLLFSKADEFKDLAIRATISRITLALAQHRLFPTDAFQMFDQDKSNELHCAEMVVAMEYLLGKNTFTPQQIEEVFDHVDKNKDRRISLQEFKETFSMENIDIENVAEVKPAGQLGTVVPTQSMAPGRKSQPFGTLVYPPAPALKRAGRFKLRVDAHKNFLRLWTTEGTMAEKPVSFWTPSNLRDTFTTKVARKVCFGHYAEPSFKDPRNSGGGLIVEVTDEKAGGLFSSRDTTQLDAFIAAVFPKPVKYRKVWEQICSNTAGGRSVYLWEPVPPTADFVAAGVLVTTTHGIPDPEDKNLEIRCLPKAWAKTVVPQEPVWTDVGTGGSPSCLWNVAPCQNFYATSGDHHKVQPEVQALDIAPRSQMYSDSPASNAISPETMG